VLNALLDVPYHHLIMAIPWQLLMSVNYNTRLTTIKIPEIKN
jgi:hypothetical protein